GAVLFQSGNAYLASGDRARAEEIWRQVNELAARTRDPYVAFIPLRAKAILSTLDGRLEETVTIREEFITRGEEVGSVVAGRGQASGYTLQARLYLGRGEEALADLPVAAQMAGGTEGAGVSMLRALLLAHLGRRTEAQEILLQIMAERDIGLPEDRTPTGQLTLILETALLVEDREVASLLAARLSEVASLLAVGGGTIFLPAARALGGAAALLGEREKAKEYYQQALEVCAKVRFRPEAALTRLQLAELLLAEAEDVRVQGLAPLQSDEIKREALQHLDFAIAEFQAMKMQPSLERALRHKGILKA
ncbi:MAG: hypothetical protein EXR50_07585, partial [Dehalococcoidia bacterium]|nr:hypothetical protein [Dehalococcoidia bacterium]